MPDALSQFMANRELATSQTLVSFIEEKLGENPAITVEALLAAARVQRDRHHEVVVRMLAELRPQPALECRVLTVSSAHAWS